MSGRKAKKQMDLEADRGHHNIGFENEDGEKIRAADLDSNNDKNSQEVDTPSWNKEDSKGSEILTYEEGSILVN